MSNSLKALTFSFLSALAVTVLPADFDFTIDLQQRKFLPEPLTKQALSQKSSELMNKHIFMQFDRPLTEQEKSNLASDGCQLISYIPNFAYTVKLTKTIDETLMNRHGIRWFGEIYPDDKISSIITDIGIGDWARREGGRVQYAVVLHKDEDIEFWNREFERLYNAEITGLVRSINAIELVIPELAYLSLSELDAVLWIEQDDPPQVEMNNLARANTRAEELQAPPYNLTGTGVTVAEWDGGQVDGSHPDLVGRVFPQDGAAFSNHATHVAGTVLGTGASQSGTYRGMAPGALLLSHLWWGSSAEIENEYNSAISFNGAVISTNSWGLGVGTPSEANCQSGLGGYVTANATLDEAIRGNVGLAPITICWSAGNERSSGSQYCGSIGWTYHTIGVYGAGKNLITVGAVESSGSDMTSFSSWGPTDDGRIKPDVCGPGCSLRSCAVGGGYWNACGTSMSTPATAGTIALMLEALQNAGLSYSTVLPSTVKGILVNTAVDLGLGGFPNGPDFAFGHGKVDGVAAVNKIIQGEPSYLQNSITTGTTHLYDLTIPSTGKLKVSLVWDDPGGTGIAGKTLINDLDLELVDPFSTTYQPWVLNPAVPNDPATTGIDRTNNVETVEIDSPSPGLWKARVTGFNVPDGPQFYSLVFTPDSIYTPGNLAALAVFDQIDVTDDPGDSALVSFWVTNVGAAPEVVDVTINDNNGWLRATLDSTVSLDPWDSAYFLVIADIPSGSYAGDLTSVLCRAQSQADSQVTSTGSVNVIAGAYYSVALLEVSEDTVNSPQQISIDVIIDNGGNDFDRVVVSLSDELGWFISPTAIGPTVPAFSQDTVTFQVFVPAEMPHLQNNNFTISALSDNGAGDTTEFPLVVHNPFLPPQLISPDEPHYSMDRAHNFTWSGTADSYKLVIASDTLLQFPVRTYPGITDQSFTMPVGDSLNDGFYYWGIKLYVGSDSSSFQGNTRLLVIDNDIPLAMSPQSPANSQYVGQKTFTFLFGTAKLPGTESADGLSPEYVRIEIAKDTGFSNNLIDYSPISGSSFVIPDVIDEGRWYWRVERADLAGNSSGFSSPATFILDSETPEVPTQLIPGNGATVGDDTILFKWSLPPDPPYEFAPNFFRIQMSTSPQFFTVFLNQPVYADSLKLPASTFSTNVTTYWRVRAQDSASHTSSYQTSPFNFVYSTYICGDVNSDGTGGNILDLTFLVDRIFRGGPPPNPPIAGSVNCDTEVNILDLTYMVDRIFRGGPPACCL